MEAPIKELIEYYDNQVTTGLTLTELAQKTGYELLHCLSDYRYLTSMGQTPEDAIKWMEKNYTKK